MELLDPKNDYVFKRIFGYIGNEDITKGLINAIIEDIHIENLTLDCKEILEQDLKNDKFGILDIRAVIGGSIQCNIEMQMLDRKDIENRILFYWSRIYAKTIQLGEDYIKAQRTIIILFTDYEIDSLKSIQKYLSKWHIREEEYTNIILTKNLELCIIELPKYKKYISKNKELSKWVKFITNPGGMTMDEIKDNEALKKANKVLNEISEDEKEQELAFQRLMYKMDQKAIEALGYDNGVKDGIQQGIEQGIQQGQQQGIQQGEKEKSIEIAKKMLADKLSIEVIMNYTGLTKEEIEDLK